MTDTDLGANLDASIYERMAAVLRDLPAIAKASENKQQNYMFRGIDDVLNALNPVLAKHGVFYTPTVLEARTEQRTSGKGNSLYATWLHVQYTFYGLAGDTVTASAWGEGTDSLDKATNKAMTGAMKYCLFQVFAISTKEGGDADTDHNPGEETLPKWMGPIIQRLDGLPKEYRAKAVTSILKANKQEPGEDIEWLAMTNQSSWDPWFDKLFTKAEAAAAKAQQDADAEADAVDVPPSDASTKEGVSTEAVPSPEESAPDRSAPVADEPQVEPEPAPAPEPEPDPEPPADDPRPVADPTPPPSSESTAEQDIRYEEACAIIDAMKGPALQKELRDNQLEPGGSVPDLKKRLKEFVRDAIYSPADEAEELPDEPDGEVDNYDDDGYDTLVGVPIAKPQQAIVVSELEGATPEVLEAYAYRKARYPWDGGAGLPDDVGEWDMAAAMRMIEVMEEAASA